MSALRVHVLGRLSFSSGAAGEVKLPGAVSQTLAILVAAGPYGLDKDQLARELWGDDLPPSWKSSLRNRFTTARRVLGPSAISNKSRRYALASTAQVDSWDLVKASTSSHLLDDPTFEFLHGEPFEGLALTPIMALHAEAVASARGALVSHCVDQATHPLAPPLLQTLRNYQRLHALDPVTTDVVVQAQLAAGDRAGAAEVIARAQAESLDAGQTVAPWVRRLVELTDPKASTQDVSGSAGPHDAEPGEELRSDLFALAVAEDNWRLALEVAMSGLPAAEKAHGDPSRIALLSAIPLDRLDRELHFTLAITLARSYMWAGSEDLALEWARKARSLSVTANDVLVAHITAAIVGDVDEYAALPLPEAFADLSHADVNLRSLQVAVVSHIERADHEVAESLVRRFSALVEASGQPFRRWFTLLLASMDRFVEGEWEAAGEVADRAQSYGRLFKIADVDIVRVAQELHPNWVKGDASPPSDAIGRLSNDMTGRVVDPLRAIFSSDSDTDAVDAWLRTTDLASRSINVVPTLVLVAPYVAAPDMRQSVRKRLAARAGTSAILGTGVMHLGPVDRALAQLSDAADDVVAHLRAAIQVADRQRTQLWQVLCRLELSDATGDATYADQARAIASSKLLKEMAAQHNL